jgi:hypothetical protein
MPINLDEIRDLMRKLENTRGGRPRKPHIPVSEWLRWIEPYQTPEERDEIQKICEVVGGFDYGSDEYQVLMHRFQELEDVAEDRAYAAPVRRRPRGEGHHCLYDHLLEATFPRVHHLYGFRNHFQRVIVTIITV